MNPLRLAIVAAIVAAGAAVLIFTPIRDAVSLEQFSSWLEPHRRAWYALPLVAAAFTALGLVLFPVLVLIAATGVAFGPWLGPIYAMVGCLASGSAGFALGRWAGPQRVEGVGGPRIAKIRRTLERNGTLAVFLLRKVPAPFMVSNVVAGASKVRFRDFLLGTFLGMAALVVALAGFGYQLTEAFRNPSWSTMLLAAGVLGVPLGLAWSINRVLKRTKVAG